MKLEARNLTATNRTLIEVGIGLALFGLGMLITLDNISSYNAYANTLSAKEAQQPAFMSFLAVLGVWVSFLFLFLSIKQNFLTINPMKFKKADINDICGSSLQGYITEDYNKLVEVFGEPTDSDGYKIDAEWMLKFDDGVVATIYNYKDGKNYNGSDGLDVEDITNWHIGGFDNEVIKRIQDLLK
jgi:hypothetical protein